MTIYRMAVVRANLNFESFTFVALWYGKA